MSNKPTFYSPLKIDQYPATVTSVDQDGNKQTYIITGPSGMPPTRIVRVDSKDNADNKADIDLTRD